MCTNTIFLFEGGQAFYHRVAKVAQSHDLEETSRLDHEADKKNSMDLSTFDRVSLINEKRDNTNTTVEGVSKDSDTIYDTDDPDEVHPSVTSYDSEKLLQEAKVLQASKGTQKAKISFYDFAGQDIFHASHPTFLSSKAVYILVFNLKTMLECNNKETKATQDSESDKGRILTYFVFIIELFT